MPGTITLKRPSAPPSPDADALRAVVHRRLALRYALTAPVAAAIAALAGIGPREARK